MEGLKLLNQNVCVLMGFKVFRHEGIIITKRNTNICEYVVSMREMYDE